MADEFSNILNTSFSRGTPYRSNISADKTVPVNSPAGGLAYNSVISGSNKWSPEQWQNFGAQGGTIDANNNLVFGNDNLSGKQPGMMDWLGSNSMRGIGILGELAMSGLGIWNQMGAQKEAKKQWSAENDRANQVMAMNSERYNQWKSDRNRLNSEYV